MVFIVREVPMPQSVSGLTTAFVASRSSGNDFETSDLEIFSVFFRD